MSPNTPAIRTTTRSCRPRRRIHCRRTYPRISTTRLSPDDGAEGRRRMTRPSSSANIASVQSQTRPGGGRSASWCRWGRRKFRYLHTPRCRMHPPLTSPRSWSLARTHARSPSLPLPLPPRNEGFIRGRGRVLGVFSCRCRVCAASIARSGRSQSFVVSLACAFVRKDETDDRDVTCRKKKNRPCG